MTQLRRNWFFSSILFLLLLTPKCAHCSALYTGCTHCKPGVHKVCTLCTECTQCDVHTVHSVCTHSVCCVLCQAQQQPSVSFQSTALFLQPGLQQQQHHHQQQHQQQQHQQQQQQQKQQYTFKTSSGSGFSQYCHNSGHPLYVRCRLLLA